MNTVPFRFLPALLAIALATCLPQTSHALFGREKAKMLRQADETYTEAISLGEQGRVLDEMAQLAEARARYVRILSEFPGFHADHIEQMVAKCSLRIASLHNKIKSGEIALPSPEAIAEGAGKGFVAPGSTPPPPAPDEGRPIPSLVPVEAVDPDLTVATPAEAPVVTPAAPTPTPPNPAFDKPIPAPAPAAEAPAEPDASTDAQSVLARANDALRLRLVQAIVEKDGPAQAMLMLEELLEAEGDKASETTRALFVRTLIACRNYKRAAIELDALRERHPDSPATLSLAAAVAAQTGNLPEAIFQLDRLVQRHPAYSDAYVNLAYAYFMLDPVKNREMATVYYRSGISYGAGRDPKLEEILDLEIVQ